MDFYHICLLLINSVYDRSHLLTGIAREKLVTIFFPSLLKDLVYAPIFRAQILCFISFSFDFNSLGFLLLHFEIFRGFGVEVAYLRTKQW